MENLSKKAMQTLKAIGFGAMMANGVGTKEAYSQESTGEVRVNFRILDNNGNELRQVKEGTNLYHLEVYADLKKSRSSPIVGLQWSLNFPAEIVLQRVRLPESGHYETNDFFYPFEMDQKANYVSSSGRGERSTKSQVGRKGRVEGGGLLAKYTFTVQGPITNSFTRNISLDEHSVFGGDSLEIRNGTSIKSYFFMMTPENDSNVYLIHNNNNGETIPSDSGKYNLFRQWQNYMTPDSVPEPIVVGNGKANVLERSVGDASGPWTAVWTNKPTVGNMSASGAFSDKEMKGFDKVFYRVREYTGQ